MQQCLKPVTKRKPKKVAAKLMTIAEGELAAEAQPYAGFKVAAKIEASNAVPSN
jgi:hypothetical protein